MDNNQQLSESRFYMWRAVFAMAHVDGKVTQEELDFAEQYLERAPFTQEHREILKDDLAQPQNVGEMLMHVSDLSDQADFFQFSHMLAWADSDYSAREQGIMDRLNAEQMQKFNKADVAKNIKEARKAAILRRALEDEEFARQARDVSGFANVIRFVVPWMEMRQFEAPDAEMFKLWRAVFSLVHADDDLADEERGYIEGMMDVFRFSAEQQEIVQNDLNNPPDTVVLFQALKNTRHRKQFFVMARTIIWCDGVFHDKEKEVLESLVASLGNTIEIYENELKWINKKPEAISNNDWETGEESMMKSVVRQMLDFYKNTQKSEDQAA